MLAWIVGIMLILGGLGWSLLELFGMHPSPPAEAVRAGHCLGLVPGMALSRHKCKIAHLGPTVAWLETAGGARFSKPRILPSPSCAVLWWKFRG